MLSLLNLLHTDKSSSDLPNQHYCKLTQHIKKIQIQKTKKTLFLTLDSAMKNGSESWKGKRLR